MLKKLKNYKHALLLLYFPFYILAFSWLETNTPKNIHIISCWLDQYIPFCEIFVIPYLLWFLFMVVAGLYFLFMEKEMFCKMMYVGMIGMTIFIIVSYLYPNGLALRPTEFARDNIFVDLVKIVYSTDTSTNVTPSIHVFNTAGICYCIFKSETLKDKKWVKVITLILSISIILATMFIKQHSVVDVVFALALVYISVDVVFNHHLAEAWERWKNRQRVHAKELQ